MSAELIRFPARPYMTVREGPKTWLVELVTPVGERTYRDRLRWFYVREWAEEYARDRAARWGCDVRLEGRQ